MLAQAVGPTKLKLIKNNMTLEKEILSARTEIVSDGYEMSVGEVLNLYRDHEIIISPDFQRLFRWGISSKTRFIESLLLGIPIPPIFVFQNEEGVWELIDGLQRLSTIFEFVGVLEDPEGGKKEPSVLDGTRFLPSLAGRKWTATNTDGEDGIGQAQQLQIKRARLRVEILKQESDPKAKYELFQRLNTGGAGLSEQEVRNCVAVMLNKPFYNWLKERASTPSFLETIDQTENALERQMATELALRFIAFRSVPYVAGLDLHEYLDEALVTIASNEEYDQAAEEHVFTATFDLLKAALSSKAFKRWDGTDFKGKFLMSVFEVVATGVSHNLTAILEHADSAAFVTQRCQALWQDEIFQRNSGAGVRGTQRLSNLLPMAKSFFEPA